MIATCVQFDIAWQDKPVNFQKIRSLLVRADKAADGGLARTCRGGLIVLPEMFSTGFTMDLRAADEAQDRPAERFLAELACQYGCYVLGGVVNVASDGLGRNEALLVSPDGEVVLRQAKMHPFSYAGETQHFAPGDAPLVVEVCPRGSGKAQPAPKLSVMVCYDLRFPEVFRHAVFGGAEVLAVIANWPASRAEHWQALLRGRAIENQAYVVGVNRVGSDPNERYGGGSMIVDPRGRIVAQAGDGEEVLSAELDIGALRAYRDEFPALRDIRREMLGL